MRRYYKEACFRTLVVRICVVLFALVAPIHIYGVGYTPTDAGLYVNFQKGDQFLLSVWIDRNNNGVEDAGEEFFVCDYPSEQPRTPFNYSGYGNFLKLFTQNTDATKPSAVSIWTIGDPLTHNNNGYTGVEPDFTLDGPCYTMWSSAIDGNPSKTLVTTDGEFKYLGALTEKNKNTNNQCDVVFIVPTVQARTNMDPDNTLGRIYPFDGKTGRGFLGMIYREVYWFFKPKSNHPLTYTQMGLVTFNTTSSNKTWSAGTINPGKAAYAYADGKHTPTTRTLFRLYNLTQQFDSCASFFFAHDVQDNVTYRDYEAKGKPLRYSTSRKIYSSDHHHCMEQVDDSKYFKSGFLSIPNDDSTYYYIGKAQEYYSKLKEKSLTGQVADTAYSQFRNIRRLRVNELKDAATIYTPASGAYGRIVVDTTTNAENLGATFEPAGYFLKVSTGRNIRLDKTGDHEWTTEEAWTITPEWANLTIKATMFTGEQFSETDPGADILNWSRMVKGTSIPLEGSSENVVGKTGRARIYTNSPDSNGHIVFFLVDSTHYIRYHNNGHFGAERPIQYATTSSTWVKIQEARLIDGYKFDSWNTAANGSGTTYLVDDDVDLSTAPVIDGKHVLDLYAQATYVGDINVAISFLKEDGERYFLTLSGKAPRFARARHYTDWTNVSQGMGDITNENPNYLNTFKIIGNPTCIECGPQEYVLDPHRTTMYGGEDSLVFWENIQPDPMEYIGLYYEPALNLVLSNNSWAGLFVSSKGWPSPLHACIDSTRLYSTHYLGGTFPDNIEKKDRNGLPPVIKYNETEDQFDGVAVGDSTSFMISGVGVADAHYVIIPKTDSEIPWTDSITFDYHETARTTDVMSELIGKHLLAQMKVGKDTMFFHPDPNSTKNPTTAEALELAQDYRLTQRFTYIPDSRVPAPEELPAAGTGFRYTVTSGETSPKNIMSGGKYIDIVDTLRVSLLPGAKNKIKEYYGRWSTKDPNVHIRPDGSRYRDIIVTTKTYHYGDDLTDIRLIPQREVYNFPSLNNRSEDVNFTLRVIKSHWLLDKDNNPIREEIISSVDTTVLLDLTTGTTFSLAEGDNIFILGTPTRTGIRLTTKTENTTAPSRDTLTVTTTITIDDTPQTITAKVPLLQVSTQGTELVWSVEYSGKQYFIFASSAGTGLRFKTFATTGSRLVNSTQELIIGARDADNNDPQYITPWKWTDVNSNQLTLKTEYGVNRYFHINGSVGSSTTDPTALTFILDTAYTNSNGNYEEIVYLKYTDKWLKFDGVNTRLVLVDDTVGGGAFKFSWGYMLPEYNLLNNGDYPSTQEEVFGYNTSRTGSVQTRYKAYLDHSMLLNNQLVYVAKTEEENIANLKDAYKVWKTQYTVNHVRDSRFDSSASGLSTATSDETLTTTVTQSGTSPIGVTYNGKYVDIVDTLDFRITLQEGAPAYRFKEAWSGFSSVEDAHLKIPLIRKTYHQITYDSIICTVEKDENNFSFPATLRKGVRKDSVHTFTLHTERHRGYKVFDVDNLEVAVIADEPVDTTSAMNLKNMSMAEIRLTDEYGKKPTWCQIIDTTANTLTVKCLSNGIRVPRVAYINLAYAILVNGKMRYVNYRLTVSQASLFHYDNNQTLIHSSGASGDPLMKDGRQYTHENKRILYYYNPAPYNEPDQNVELPVRERGFYGWWRWYREGKDQNGVDVSETDIPDSVWQTPPRNVGKKNFPYRIIGDSVWVYTNNEKTDSVKVLKTMGRYTVFHYPSKEYNNKKDPPAKSPLVYPPFNKDTVTYVVDISNYTDNLPFSMTHVNQIDTARLEEMEEIIEPTLSLREVFELHPWTEMAERLDTFKYTAATPWASQKYMEDHVVMAPIGNRLLLKTEQRYNYKNMTKEGHIHSESLLGYYMRDDDWKTWSFFANDKEKEACQDTMIWCGGWDADCIWYTYNPKTNTYDTCKYEVTVDDDFLNVPAKTGISSGHEFDTVYYCLRAQSKKTEDPRIPESTVDGDYWFNICRYKIIYHRTEKYGPLAEKMASGRMKALKTNVEIEENYEVLERLNFDYNKPTSEYTIYPHPLKWEDASYGYTYSVSASLPQNRYHDEKDFPGPGEYSLINKIPYEAWWHKIAQHGGDTAGYMIYCDGMSASGQVAALSLETNLCEGQKLYFSGYVANVSNQSGKANPNLTFSVQGQNEKTKEWEDISSYMTGDLKPTPKTQNLVWSQILFPIEHEHAYTNFRVRIYNMASDFDGNDFVIDDMCIYATKPPLIAYQANTRCVEQNQNDSIIYVVLRVDYQGFVDQTFNNAHVYYTVEKMTKDSVFSFVPMLDGYLNDSTAHGANPSVPDTVFGWIPMPAHTYEPYNDDSIFVNLNHLANRFEQSEKLHEEDPDYPLFRQGYIYENLDGDIRPVLYTVHKAKMTSNNVYTVRMSLGKNGLMNSKCAMTTNLKVTSRMMLVLNGEEQTDNETSGLCGNTTHDLSLRVRGTLIQDSVAPIDITGTCKNDWLIYGDTAADSSLERYGYTYHDIVKVVKDILRYEPLPGETNMNQFARSLGGVNRTVMNRIMKNNNIKLETSDDPYKVLSNLVKNGYLIMYKSNLEANLGYGDSARYVVFPILGTGSDDLYKQNMEVCPNPLVITLKSKTNTLGSPLIIGGLRRDSALLSRPVIVLADAFLASSGVAVPVDSIRTMIGVRSVHLLSTDDPNFREGVHRLDMEPDKKWPGDQDNYYVKGDTMLFTPATDNTYQMRPGYNYTFNIEMVSASGESTDVEGCPIGDVPFTISYVPDYLRWDPKDAENNLWNNPNNWIGITPKNEPIHETANFAPLPSTKVVIPAVAEGMPYPVLPETITSADSVQEVGFAYNVCDAIRFLPGAAIGQQQNLVYNDAIVDMTLPNGKWALRTSPVKGLVSGDLFMAEADLKANANPWEVGEFDADGRSASTGNASFWISVFSRETVRKGNGDQVADTARVAEADWSKVTNALTLPLPAGQGFAVYTKTKSNTDAIVRLPKKDDRYYYFYKSGGRVDELFEDDIQALRNTVDGNQAGRFAFSPKRGDDSQSYTITNDTASTGARIETTTFIFGNPTMAFIDIWGFIADNSLQEQFRYIGEDGNWKETVTKAAALLTKDTITTIERYLPPMKAIEVQVAAKTYTKDFILNNSRVVVAAPTPAPTPAPKRVAADNKLPKGIMTIAAVNPVSTRCTSRLLLGQGFNDAVIEGEDALLTTVNIDKYSNTSYPATPFNIYAVEQDYGLNVDLRERLYNVPLSFYMSDMPFDSITQLWFTGVYNIDGQLFLYDALTKTQRPIIDGICLTIETPKVSHQRRYYIQQLAFPEEYNPHDPDDPTVPEQPITTDGKQTTTDQTLTTKIIHAGHVYIIRNGHVYTIFGQQIR